MAELDQACNSGSEDEKIRKVQDLMSKFGI